MAKVFCEKCRSPEGKDVAGWNWHISERIANAFFVELGKKVRNKFGSWRSKSK